MRRRAVRAQVEKKTLLECAHKPVKRSSFFCAAAQRITKSNAKDWLVYLGWRDTRVLRQSECGKGAKCACLVTPPPSHSLAAHSRLSDRESSFVHHTQLHTRRSDVRATLSSHTYTLGTKRQSLFDSDHTANNPPSPLNERRTEHQGCEDTVPCLQTTATGGLAR